MDGFLWKKRKSFTLKSLLVFVFWFLFFFALPALLLTTFFDLSDPLFSFFYIYISLF